MLIFWMVASLCWATPASEALERGMAAQRAGDTVAARAAYKHCLELDAKHAQCHWEMGWNYWTDNAWDQVVWHWRQVEQISPDHPELDEYLPMAVAQLELLQRIRQEATSAPTTLRPELPDGKTLRLRAAGDIMLYSDFPNPEANRPPEDGRTLLSAVTPWLEDADVTFGNYEGTLCDGGKTTKCGSGGNCYAFRTPTRYATFLQEAGIDLMSTANNHAQDFGATCREQTEKALDAVGIKWSGRPGTIGTVEHDGMRIGLVAFHTSQHSNYINDHDAAAALVRAAKADHDLVVVSFHGGAEGSRAMHVPDRMETFYGEQRGHLRKFARRVIEAGADLVIGHGPHVLRGLEVIDGHLVAYSLGNFATYGPFNLSGHLSTSAVLEVTLDHQGQLVAGKILPVRLMGRGIPMPDPENTAIDLIRSLTKDDFPTSGPIIAQDGVFQPPADVSP